MRVRGSGQIVRDTELLTTMSVKQRQPKLAILVRVKSAMFHCGKAMIRSNMWQPEKWASIQDLPTYAEALIDHAKPPYTLNEMEARVANNELKRLYDDEPF